jgi:predicted DsbA family dithiol-disulfide isomerase
MESPLVTADCIEAIEFPHLANRYSVQGVPRTVINEKVPLEGAYPEPMVVEAIKKALGEEA